MEAIIDRLRDKFSSAIVATSHFRGDETAIVTKEAIVPVLTYLKDHLGFDVLIDLCGADYFAPPQPSTHPRQADFSAVSRWRNDVVPVKEGERFEVVYHLYSIEKKCRLRIKVRVSEADAEVDTACGLWKAANWAEREVFDMYGITFRGHPNLKRILTYPEFEGHPLRKDYPIEKRGVVPTPDDLLDELERRKAAAVAAQQARMGKM